MTETTENTKRITRMGMMVLVQEFDGKNWRTISTCRSIDKFNGKPAKLMTDDELLATWTPTSRDWSH